jgi:hypothetical protein
VVGWDRATIPIDDYHAMDAFVACVAPEVLVHLAIASSRSPRHRPAVDLDAAAPE